MSDYKRELLGEIDDLRKDIADLQAQLAKLQWIKVTPETMPEEGQEVIATNGIEWYKMKMFMGKLSFSGSHLFDATFTHYKPIDLPEKEKSDG